MVALVQRGEGKATFGDVLANTSYHMGDVRWDMHRGHIKVVDSSQVEQQRTLPMEGELKRGCDPDARRDQPNETRDETSQLDQVVATAKSCEADHHTMDVAGHAVGAGAAAC
jgi:hypothetical protein